MKEKSYIPIKVYKEKQYDTWYLDVSSLSLEELLHLREELLTTGSASVVDRIMHQKVVTSTFTSTYNTKYHKRNKKNKKILEKKRHKKGRYYDKH